MSWGAQSRSKDAKIPCAQRTQSGFGCPLRIPELARARPSLRCAPFKYFCCVGRIRCVTIYSFFGAEEMDFVLSDISRELGKRVFYALQGKPL